jgi:hypothetical protein
LPRSGRKAAESASLVFNVFVRIGDDTSTMVQRGRVGDTFVSFDHDQAFNPAYRPFAKFARDLEGNKTLPDKANQFWTAGDFDLDVIEEMIGRIEALDIDELLEQVKFQCEFTKGTKATMGKRTVFIMSYLSVYLEATKKSIRKDTMRTFEILTGISYKDARKPPAKDAVLERAKEAVRSSIGKTADITRELVTFLPGLAARQRVDLLEYVLRNEAGLDVKPIRNTDGNVAVELPSPWVLIIKAISDSCAASPETIPFLCDLLAKPDLDVKVKHPLWALLAQLAKQDAAMVVMNLLRAGQGAPIKGASP